MLIFILSFWWCWIVTLDCVVLFLPCSIKDQSIIFGWNGLNMLEISCWLGGIPTPLKNMGSSVGIIIPNIRKHKIHVPNHQPAMLDNPISHSSWLNQPPNHRTNLGFCPSKISPATILEFESQAGHPKGQVVVFCLCAWVPKIGDADMTDMTMFNFYGNSVEITWVLYGIIYNFIYIGNELQVSSIFYGNDVIWDFWLM